MDPMSFFTTYFAKPLCDPLNGYNIYNTLAYGLLVVILAFGLFKLLKLFKIKIDKKFFWGGAPFVVLGSLWHVYADSVPQCLPYLQTPFVYILFALIGILSVTIGLLIEKKSKIKMEYWHFMVMVAGIAFVLSAFRFFELARPMSTIKIFGLTAVFLLLFYALSKKWDKLFSPMNVWIMTAAMFDAASTVVGMTAYGYSEKHILPTFVINLFGTPWVMLPLKFIVIVFALYFIDKLEEDTQFNNIIKFAILVVTLGPGSRNTLRMLMGV